MSPTRPAALASAPTGSPTPWPRRPSRKVVPRTLDELSRDAEPPSIWEGPGDRERRERTQKEQELKVLIEEIDPAIASAYVSIGRAKTPGGLGARSLVSCFIRLRTVGGLPLNHRVIEGIETFLKAAIPDLKPEAITVADQTGHKYSSGRPATRRSRKRTRSTSRRRTGATRSPGGSSTSPA